jgi:hypothetical protein
MSDEYCGWPTADDTACEHPPTEDDGRCWQHTDEEDPYAPGGRPTKFTDERAREAIEAAREAKSIAGCGRACGVVRNTIMNWLQQNPEFTDESGETRDFLPTFLRARAKAETLLTRGSLTRPDEIDGSHARFLLKTSFGYQEVDRIEFDDVSDEQEEDDLNELADMADDLF